MSTPTRASCGAAADARHPSADDAHGITLERLVTLGESDIRGLGDVLIDCVEGGSSVSFMWPMTRAKADAFWQRTARALAAGERLLWCARDRNRDIIGTVQVILEQPENQPHRADLAKMLVHRRARRTGTGARLLAAAEAGARAAGKTLLLLDTASADAERLYQRGGWQRSGEVPGYALLPDGAPCATVFYWKALTAAAAPPAGT